MIHTVRIFEFNTPVYQSEPIFTHKEGLICMAMFLELYISAGFVISRPFHGKNHFRASKKTDAIKLDIYLTDEELKPN